MTGPPSLGTALGSGRCDAFVLVIMMMMKKTVLSVLFSDSEGERGKHDDRSGCRRYREEGGTDENHIVGRIYSLERAVREFEFAFGVAFDPFLAVPPTDDARPSGRARRRRRRRRREKIRAEGRRGKGLDFALETDPSKDGRYLSKCGILPAFFGN